MCPVFGSVFAQDGRIRSIERASTIHVAVFNFEISGQHFIMITVLVNLSNSKR
jgi:hypothetical protein